MVGTHSAQLNPTEIALFRSLLRWYGEELQHRGKLPADASLTEIEAFLERYYAAPALQALQEHPRFEACRRDNTLESLICRVFEYEIGDNIRRRKSLKHY